MSSLSSSSHHTRCAACKYLRKSCPSDCIFSPYFPSNNPQRFSFVHKVFGASNVGKMLKRLPVELRGEAADTMHFEATCRIENRVYGCVGIISQLQQQIHHVETELAMTRAEIALFSSTSSCSSNPNPNFSDYAEIIQEPHFQEEYSNLNSFTQSQQNDNNVIGQYDNHFFKF
ncbi:hypothetical protein G4B88_000552 [Cannabis sativa]|uniref:LOB domain-containing protein n=1 Tax=Cannabis sativa TaxID=3483 RepID=A0A7J6ERA8_CANSA|nr:hypothetical protein G4B88_000552 [Cannabis sativa]